MVKLPLPPITQSSVKAIITNPPAVLILHGLPGSGKRDLAESIVANILGVVQEKLTNYPYLTVVEPEKGSISIDQVRNLQASLVRSVPGEKPIRRAVIIDQAQTLTAESQNALLKSLEEPPLDTVFVLCVDSLHNLLPTVVSRGRPLAILPLPERTAKRHFGSTTTVDKAYHMSGGRAALMQALLSESDHPLIESIENAKDILQKTPYQRLLLINNLSKDKATVETLLESLQLLARVSLTSAVQSGKPEQAKRWHQINKQTIASQKALGNNAGIKLVLTDLFLNL